MVVCERYWTLHKCYHGATQSNMVLLCAFTLLHNICLTIELLFSSVVHQCPTFNTLKMLVHKNMYKPTFCRCICMHGNVCGYWCRGSHAFFCLYIFGRRSYMEEKKAIRWGLQRLWLPLQIAPWHQRGRPATTLLFVPVAITHPALVCLSVCAHGHADTLTCAPSGVYSVKI